MFVRFVSLFFIAALMALLTVPVAADPPFPPKQNRQNDTRASGFEYSGTGSGFRQVGIEVYQSYDVKGNYENSSIRIHEFEVDYTATGYTETHRLLECQVPREAFFVTRYFMEAEAVLNPASPDCSGFRRVCTDALETGYSCVEDANHGFWEQWVLGYWDYATINGQNVSNWRFWDNTTNDQWVTKCDEFYGDGMRAGGFYILDTWYPFTGFDGNTSSNYNIVKCNDKMP